MNNDRRKRRLFSALSFFLSLVLLISLFPHSICAAEQEKPSYIRWIDFTPSSAALRDCLRADVAAKENGPALSFVELLAALAQQYGGKFSHYRRADLDAYVERARTTPLAEQVGNKKLYAYYKEAYHAVLSGLVGHYTEERTDGNGGVVYEKKYGLKGFYPIAAGYHISHSDDFGVARSYGYRRRHLGHDMFGSVGTPVVAIESGVVEALGWNQYGGWRIGIRSFDGLRYYYYAHLRKDHPYANLYEGQVVCAGDVIGYLGMTGYSAKENVNNIQVPHLHVGLQIIFDKSQKDGTNQIWIDMYQLVNFLSENRVRAYREGEEMRSHLHVVDEEMPD